MKVVTDKLNDQWLKSKLKEIQEVNGYYQQCRDKIIEALENHDYINDSVIQQYNGNVKYLRDNGAITEGEAEAVYNIKSYSSIGIGYEIDLTMVKDITGKLTTLEVTAFVNHVIEEYKKYKK